MVSEKNMILTEDDTRRVVGMPTMNYVKPYELEQAWEAIRLLRGDVEEVRRLVDEVGKKLRGKK